MEEHMKITDTIIEPPVYGYKFPQNKEEILFLDIETTGLSPDASSLYMIGVMYFDTAAGSWHIKQFFADNYKSEAEILLAFLNILGNYNYLYHFNGKTFDIPYILNKFRKYNIKPDMHCSRIFNNTDTEYSIDILALIRPLKKLLSIKKATQTALEQWLGITRENKYNGEQLIPIYSQYMQYKFIAPSKATQLEKLLLLHNHDDIKHMLNICSILSYYGLFQDTCNITITGIKPGTGSYINIIYSHNITIPKNISITKQYPASKEKTIQIQDMKLELSSKHAILSVPLFYGNLKYFYPDYKNYYFIETEDTAVHKSLIHSSCKNYKKASVSTCYTKKEGLFIPSMETWQSGHDNIRFYITYHDKLCFYILPDGTADINNPFWNYFVKRRLILLL